MSSEENQFSLASKEEENYYVYSVKAKRNQLARRCLYCLLIGLVLVGTLLLKFPGSIVYIRFNSPSSLTVVKPELSAGQPNDHGKCPQVGPLSPRHTTLRLNLMNKYFASEIFETFSANLLSKAVKYQTVSYDKMADPDFSLDEPAYRPFPTIHQSLHQRGIPPTRQNARAGAY